MYLFKADMKKAAQQRLVQYFSTYSCSFTKDFGTFESDSVVDQTFAYFRAVETRGWVGGGSSAAHLRCPPPPIV